MVTNAVNNRQAVEMKIAKKLLTEATRKGWLYRCEEDEKWFATFGELVNGSAVFDLDECFVYFTDKDGARQGCVKLVFGNDGWDVIADYSTRLEEFLTPVIAYAMTFER